MKTQKAKPSLPTPAVKPDALLNTTWQHKSLRQAGPAVGLQLPNQFIVKGVSPQYVSLWQVGSLTKEPTVWTKADFLANFIQLNTQ